MDIARMDINISMKKWGLGNSAECDCGEPEQTADHIT